MQLQHTPAGRQKLHCMARRVPEQSPLLQQLVTCVCRVRRYLSNEAVRYVLACVRVVDHVTVPGQQHVSTASRHGCMAGRKRHES